jgi:hypothetical protein
MADITARYLARLARSPERLREFCELEQAVQITPRRRDVESTEEVMCSGAVELGVSGTTILTCGRALRGKCPNSQVTLHGDHTPPRGVNLSERVPQPQ